MRGRRSAIIGRERGLRGLTASLDGKKYIVWDRLGGFFGFWRSVQLRRMFSQTLKKDMLGRGGSYRSRFALHLDPFGVGDVIQPEYVP